MKNYLKITAVVMILIIMVLSLSGCKGDNKKDNNTNQIQKMSNGDTLYKPSEDNLRYDESNFIIYFNDVLIVHTFSNLNEDEANELANMVDGEIVGDMRGVYQIKVKESSLDELKNMAQILMKSENVIYAGYEYPMYLQETEADSNPWSSSNDNPEQDRGNEINPNGNDWWAEAIGAYTAWDYSDKCQPIKVGILDNGFWNEHDDLSGQITFLEDYQINTEENHGTHVAGIIAAKNNDIGIRGIADTSELVCVDYSPNNKTNYLSNGEYISIIRNLIENNVKVINNSWGEHFKSREKYNSEQFFKRIKSLLPKKDGENESVITDTYEDYLEYEKVFSTQSALECMLATIRSILDGYNDFLIVQGSGNGYDNKGPGIDTKNAGFYCAIDESIYNLLNEEKRNKLLNENNISYNSIDEHIIIVGAVENITDNNGNYQMCDFSNYGVNVDICAPGKEIYSTVNSASSIFKHILKDEFYRYENMSGTSMSAPIVTGSAALIWSLKSELSTAEVKNCLLNNTNKRAYGVGEGSSFECPMLNVGQAVKSIMEEIKMTDFIGMTFDKIAEKYGENYVKYFSEASMKQMVIAYKDDTPFSFTFDISDEAAAAEKPNSDSLCSQVRYNKSGITDINVDSEISPNISYAELQVAKKGMLWQKHGMYIFTYNVGDISVDFEYYSTPEDDSVADFIYISKRNWETTQNYILYQSVVNDYNEACNMNHGYGVYCSCSWALCDIDGDKTEELIIQEGVGEQDRTQHIYTIKNGKAVELGKYNAWHLALYDDVKGDGKLIGVVTDPSGPWIIYNITIDKSSSSITETESGKSTNEPLYSNQIEFTDIYNVLL